MTWFAVKDLERLASAASCRRGEEYLDAVDGVETVPGGVVATVRGTDEYTVRLGRAGRRLTGECSCPQGAVGAFCKHCVAVGLFVLENGVSPGVEPDLVGYLGSLAHGELVSLLVRYAERDPIVHRELALRAASNGSDRNPDSAALADQVDAALTVGAPGSGDMLDYAAKAESVLDVLKELQTAGHVDTMAPLARRAVDRMASALQSQGYLSTELSAAWDRALALVVQVCTQSPPDPAELATWLLGHALNTDYWPRTQLAAFIPALGAKGLAALRKQAERARTKRRSAAWDDEARLREDKLWQLREELAVIAGDVDGHVAVLSELLPDSSISLRIAKVLWQANRTDKALDYARREISRNSTQDTTQMTDFLSDVYLQLGRGEDALALRRSQFDAKPTSSTYRYLREIATKLEKWSQIREDALHALRQAAASRGSGDKLAYALLDESDVEGAWQVVLDHQCSSNVQMYTARLRGHTHPAEVLPVFYAAVDEYIEQKKPSVYRTVADLVREVRDLHTRAGTPAEFQHYLDRLRAQYPRKTKLFEEIEKVLR
ncbi:MAG: SWIM zinc finger family protein [Pseudonocardiaceae bacterium]